MAGPRKSKSNAVRGSSKPRSGPERRDSPGSVVGAACGDDPRDESITGRHGGKEALRRRYASHHVAEYEGRYRSSGNPVFAWRAYLECRGAKLEIPEWVLTYFDGPARVFWRWSTPIDGRPPTGKKLSDGVLAALRLKRRGKKGRGNLFAEVFPDAASLALAGSVHFALRTDPLTGGKVYRAIDIVREQAGVSRATVQRAWGRHRAEIRQAELDAGMPLSPCFLSEKG
jgi:hypothetical protein